MPAFLLPLLGGLWRAVVALAGSPVGGCLAAFVAGWVISGNRVRAQWATERAAAVERIEDTEAALRDLGAAATGRVVEEMASASAREKMIAEDEPKDSDDGPQTCTIENKVVRVFTRPCTIRSDDRQRVLQLNARRHFSAHGAKAEALRRSRQTP